MINTYEEAYACVSQKFPEISFQKVGPISSNSFLVLPDDENPEGTPGFEVLRESGSLIKRSIHDMPELEKKFGSWRTWP